MSCVAEPRWNRNHNAIHLYMLHSVSFDTLQSQLSFHGDVTLPEFFQRDIESLCVDLALGMPGVAWDVSPEQGECLNAEPGVAGLYLTISLLFRGEVALAMSTLATWVCASSELLLLYPALGFSCLALQLMAGVPDVDCHWPESDALDRTQLHEGLRQIALCKALLKSSLQEKAKRRLLAIVYNTRRAKALLYYRYAPEYNEALDEIGKGAY